MKTKAASKESNENCDIHTALGGAGEPPSNDTVTRLERGSVTARTNAAIGVYWGSIARPIEIIYLFAAFGVLGGIPPLFNVAIKCARYLITRTRGSQAQLAACNFDSARVSNGFAQLTRLIFSRHWKSEAARSRGSGLSVPQSKSLHP
jgi:hypothetical protein